MFPSDNYNPLIKELLSKLGSMSGNDSSSGKKEQTGKNSRCSCSGNCNQGSGASGSGTKGPTKNKIGINPSQALVIAGILGGTLEVLSVLVDRNQEIQIVLSGSLKERTELEKMMDQIGSMSFDDVMKAMLGRLSGS